MILAWGFKINSLFYTVCLFIGVICDSLDKKDMKKTQIMFLGFGMKKQSNRGYEMP